MCECAAVKLLPSGQSKHAPLSLEPLYVPAPQQRLGFRVLGVGCGFWGLGCGVWGLGFRVLGSGFGVWNLRFGVWGLRFRV